MSLDLPTPESVRADKKKRLGALFDATLHLPLLVKRLSGGLLDIDTETACRWGGWIDALQTDPAWAVVEPALTTPDAWPAVWERARQAGFSEATEHHQAIFFTRLFERAVADDNYELARQAWDEALASWRPLADGEYVRETVLEHLADELSDEQMEAVVAGLLDDPLEQLHTLGRTSLRLQSWGAAPARRPLRFVLDTMQRVETVFGDLEHAPLADGAYQAVKQATKSLHQGVIDGFHRRLDDSDLSTISVEELVSMIDGALARSRALRFPPKVDGVLLRRGLATLWDLRETGREEELDATPPFIERLEPCARRLRDADDEDLFGFQGAVADLLVFKGEEALSLDAREQAFEQALEICPGHRNASRLLSYLLLERANRDLLKTAALPDAGARIGTIRRRIRPVVDRVSGLVDRAEELYPENELIEQYRGDLRREIDRFKLDPEEDRGH